MYTEALVFRRNARISKMIRRMGYRFRKMFWNRVPAGSFGLLAVGSAAMGLK